jgi:hypothetical protein
LRRHPSLECWSWALEWNHNLRAIGFVGNADAIRESTGLLQHPDKDVIHGADGSVMTFRNEVPLEESDDVLFSPLSGLNSRDDG